MAPTGKIHPDGVQFTFAPPSTGSYYNGKEHNLPPPATYTRPRRSGAGGCCFFFTCLCSIFTVLLIVFCFSFFIFWLVVQPKAPRFEVENVRITGLNTSSDSPMNTNITYVIMARNPNKRMSFFYDDINVNVEAYGVTIGDGSIPSFHQGHKNTTFLSGEIGAQGVTFNSDTISLMNANPTIVVHKGRRPSSCQGRWHHIV